MSSAGLHLRPIEPSDRERYVCWLGDPRLVDWHGGVDSEQEVARVLRTRYHFMVETSSRPIGSVSIEADWTLGTSAELGIMIAPDHQGKGWGMHAAALALDFAFGQTAVHRVWHGVVGNNRRVLNFFRKLGFVEEGRAREARMIDGIWVDHVYFSILRQEWRGGKIL